MKKRTLILALAFVLPLAAQDPADVHKAITAAIGGQFQNTMEFLGMEMFPGKVVKNAPYSAEAVSETTQMLANGNRIHKQSSTLLYRDGEGRTRREQSLGPIGPLGNAAEPIQFINIYDPVANASYVLDTKNHTARKVTVISTDGNAKVTIRAGGYQVFTSTESNRDGNQTVTINKTVSAEHASGPVKKESLGQSVVEGVNAEGTRITHTIPAGQIGNDLPIDVVTESWYSPDLQIVVMTKTSDPRFGDTVYRLTNIIRSEPSHSLFEVPSDYTIQDGPAGIIRRTLRKEEM